MKACRETVVAIIPAFSEERFIGPVVRRVLEHVHEVLVIDDGSTDQTASDSEAAGATMIRHSTNLGKGAALKTGLRYAGTADSGFFLFADGRINSCLGKSVKSAKSHYPTASAGFG